MQTTGWRQNKWVLLAACLLFPPLGILLLWMRPRPGLLAKLGATFALLLFSVAHLFVLYGMQVELNGATNNVIVSFGGLSAHYDAIEAERAAARAVAAVAPAAEPSLDPRAKSVPETEDPTLPEAAEALASGSLAPARPTAVAPAARRANYWTDYRGPNRSGRYAETPIRTNWPAEGLPELWRIKVGGGYASMTVADGLIFTIEQRRDEEVVAAYVFDSGLEVWTNRWPGHFQEPLGGPGPRATPVWHGGNVYALGAEGEFRCIQAATGETLWRKNILEENGAETPMFALSAAPLIVDEKVIVLPGKSAGKAVVAYDKLSGERIWSSLDDQAGYASPVIAEIAGKRQMLIAMGKRLVGLDPDDGRFLWGTEWVTTYDVNATEPIAVDADHVFITSGYGKGAALFRVEDRLGEYISHEVWRKNTMKSRFNDPVLVDGVIYGLDEGILAAIDAMTGERKWKGGRYGYGQVLYAAGYLVILTEAGEVALVKATPEGWQEVAMFEALSGKTWNNPAIAHGRLLVRNQTEMASYEISGS